MEAEVAASLAEETVEVAMEEEMEVVVEEEGEVVMEAVVVVAVVRG
jgi:hypothetical protein